VLSRHRAPPLLPTTTSCVLTRLIFFCFPLDDHPHGGGRGKSKGKRIPTSPWGTPVSSSGLIPRHSHINSASPSSPSSCCSPLSWALSRLTKHTGQRRVQDKKEAQRQQVCGGPTASEHGETEAGRSRAVNLHLLPLSLLYYTILPVDIREPCIIISMYSE